MPQLPSHRQQNNESPAVSSLLWNSNSSQDEDEEDPLLFAPVEEDDIFDAEWTPGATNEITEPLVLDSDDSTSAVATESSHHIPFGAVLNLCSATLGAGILAVPYAVAQTGLVVGGLLLTVAGVVTAMSIHLIAHAAASDATSYESLVQEHLGRVQRRGVEVCMLLFCMGCAVAYIMAVGNLLSGSKTALVLVWATTMLPLSLLRTMESLSSASAIGLAAIGTLVFCSVVDYFCLVSSSTNNGEGDDIVRLQDYLWPQDGSWSSVWTALPVVLFAFSCQPNVCSIYHELDDTATMSTSTTAAANTSTKQKTMQGVATSAVSLCGGLYAVISVAVVATFGSAVRPNLLANYHSRGTFMQVAVGAMVLAVTLAYPLNIFPARVTVLGLWKRPRRHRRGNETLTQALLEDVQGVDTNEEISRDEDESGTVYRDSDPIHPEADEDSNDTWFLHVIVTLLLTTTTLLLALVLPNISVVFGLLGGTTSSWLGFVIPGWLGTRTGHVYIGYSLMAFGIVVGVVTTAATVHDTLF